MARLAARMLPFGLELTEEKKSRIQRYSTQLASWNRRLGLLSRQDIDNIVWKHVGACLGPLLLIEPSAAERRVDVGSGAGLPGIVLKIWEPAQSITLIEGSRKKCSFLEHAVRELELGDVAVLPMRVESMVARKERLGEFDVLFARAVADVRTTLDEFGPLVRPGGRIVTFKGTGWREDVEAAASAGLIGDRYRLLETVRIPWAPGHLLLMQKALTPNGAGGC